MKELEKVFCNDLQPNRTIATIDKHGEKKEWKIIKMIPMQRCHENIMAPINDIEILLDKKTNTFFSYSMYLAGTSWVKHIKIKAK